MKLGNLLFVLILLATSGRGQSLMSQRVLVVYNSAEPDSRQVASYYAGKRSIPAQNVCRIGFSSANLIEQDEYDAKVKPALRKCLQAAGREKILYIVFSYKTPWLLEIHSQIYALDQFVADIWDQYLPERPAQLQETQPYFGVAQSEGDLYQPYVTLSDYRSQSNAREIYSVWRLDAASKALAEGLVDHALEAEAHGLSGNACFDMRVPPPPALADFGYGAGDWDVYRAAEFARRAGFHVILDGHDQEFGTAPAPLRCDHAALYAGWYSLNHYNDAFSWNPGAIGIHLDSASAMDPRSGPNWSANALLHGITVTSGAVTEPYLDNLPHPDQVLWYLLHGANVGDAFLRSERLLKWRILNIGDPLYHPFANSAERAQQLEPNIIFALTPQIELAGSTSGGIVAVNQPVSGDALTFQVRSEQPALVSAPATVTIPVHDNGVRFALITHEISAEPATVRIHLDSKDLHISNTLILFSLFESLSISPGKLKANARATGLVTLRKPAPAGGVIIRLKSANPAVASVPAQIPIAEGQNRATFVVDVHTVGGDTPVLISASYGAMVRSQTITVTP